MKTWVFHRGFSILELLIVIALLALLAVFAVPAVNSSLQATRLTQGTQVILDQISLAKQAAMSKNRTMEVRFYKYANASSGTTDRFFRATQSFELQDDGSARPLDKMRALPDGVILDSGAQFSPLLGASRTKNWTSTDTQISLPGIGTSYETRSFRIHPDGSTDLTGPAQGWYLTLHAENLGDSLGTLPPNFSMLQIDPWTGQPLLYRP